MQTVSFNCPHCQKLMGVAVDLQGQEVQCPSCGRTLVAPTNAEPLVAFDDVTKVSSESHESIFGEHHDEDVFGTPPPKVDVPGGVEAVSGLMPTSLAPGHSQFAVYPPGVPQPDVPAPVEVVAAPPPATFEFSSEPSTSVPEPAPWQSPNGEAAPAPVIAPEHWPAASETPTSEPPPPASESLAWAPSAADAAEVDARRRAPSAERRKASNFALAIVVPWAVIATGCAIYYFLQYTNRSAAEHPMANIPDIFAQYEPATRRKLSRSVNGMPPVDAPLPDGLMVRLGQTLRVGDLEVTPERVEVGRIKMHTVMQDGESNVSDLGEALILHLRVRNVSSGVWFHPTDPVFDRLYDRRQGSAKPYTQVIANGYHSYGGAIDVLGTNWQRVKRKYVEGQDYDDRPLPPGEERGTIICTDPQDPKAIESVRAQPAGEPIVWRVQLRRGLTTFRGQELSTCAVIGVQFNSSDVQPAKN
jgi:hypothetical protein